MANYSSNLELAQEISARIGNEPIPFESVSGLCYQIYEELGGTRENYDDVYSILLDILPLTNLIDDTVTTTNKTWSSSKISNEISGVINDTDASTDTTYSSNKIDTLLSGKQGTLIAGQNIIINGNTISAVIDAGFSVEVVQSLPTTGETNTIYFVPILGGVNPDVYDEYMYINNAWEKIGNTSVDLSNYYNKTETDTLLAGKQGTLTAGNNIDITNNVIKAVGYTYNPTTGAFTDGDRDINDEGTIRPKSSAIGTFAHAEGSNCTAYGRASHAEGTNTTASGIQTHTEGSGTQAIATNSHAEGRISVANGYASHAEGDGAETGGDYASATTNTKTPDSRTTFAGDYAHAEGLATIAYGVASHSEGNLTFAKGNNSHAEGLGSVTSGNQGHAEGWYTKATIGNAHAEGRATEANAFHSHSEGNSSKTNSSAESSHAEGYLTETGGDYGSATSNPKTAGALTDAGAYAHAEGNATIAYGVASHSEGQKTFAKGTNSHAEGSVTIANGTNSHAEGGSVIANGSNTHAEGRYTQTLQNAEHAQGSYNKSHTDNTADGFGTNGSRTIHSIGIGTADDARKNAVEVMQNGDVYIKGIGGYDGRHIKGEITGTTVYTLQDVISNLLSYTDDLYWQLNEIKPLAPNQIRYTVNDGVEFVTNGSLPIAYTQFNDNNGVGIITYDNDLELTGNYDFSDWDGQDNITSVELPKSVTLYRISDYCFRGQTNLRQFTIPLNITEIGDCAFEDCSSLEIVKYEGTTTMWGNISFGSNIFANTMVTEVYCIDGVVQV